MSPALYHAKPDDLERLMPLVTAFHAEEILQSTEDTRSATLAPLLDGSPHRAVYLIGPQRAPIGYIVVTFGWSVAPGRLDGFVDEIFISSGARRPGAGSEEIISLVAMLKSVGMKALYLEIDPKNACALRLYGRCHFKPRSGYQIMSRVL